MLPKLFWPTVRKNCSSDREKLLKIPGWRPRISKIFEMTRIIYSNSERSEQFLVTECVLTCSWRFLTFNNLEQLEFILEKNIKFRNMQEIFMFKLPVYKLKGIKIPQLLEIISMSAKQNVTKWKMIGKILSLGLNMLYKVT